MTASSNDDEVSRLRLAAAQYHSEELAGANEEYHRFLRDSLIPAAGGVSALELGCGRGLWTSVLSTWYRRLDVVDGSVELLEEVVRSSPGPAEVVPHLALVEDFLRDATEKWQHVYMTFLLEHVQDPVAVLRLVRTRIEDDGLLFLAVPNAESVHRMLAFRAGLITAPDQLSENDFRVGHRRVYTRGLLREHA